MGVTVGTLAINIVARHESFTKGMGQVRRQLSLGELAAKSFIKVFGGIGAALAFRNAVQASREFNQAMRSSLAIMGDVSVALQEDMAAAARNASFETKFAANEAAEAYFFLASAGLDASQSIAAMPQVARFAQAGMFDLARATDLATDAQSALGLTVPDAQKNLENLTRVTDVLVKANTLANASVEQFSEALTTKAGAAIKTVGKDIEEGVAVLAAFADQGIKGSDAGTALNIVFRDLQTKAIQNAGAFKQMGVAVFDAAGEMRNSADIIRDIEQLLGGMSDEAKKGALLDLGFSDKSVVFLQTLIGTSDKIRAYEKALRSASGITREVAEKQLPPFEKGLNKLKAAFSLLADELLGPVLLAFGNVMTFIIDSLRGLNGGAAQATVQITVFAAAFAGALIIIPKIVTGIRSIVTALRTMAASQAIVAALTGPAGWLSLLGGALAAGAAVWGVTAAFEGLEQESAKALETANQAAVVNTNQIAELKEEIKDTIPEVKKFDSALARAKTITDNLRTPLESAADTINELAHFFRLGAISAETYARGVAKAKSELLEASAARDDFESSRTPQVGAVLRGTTAGFSAVRESKQIQKDMKATQEKQLAKATEQVQLTRDLLRVARNRDGRIEFAEINLD